MKVVDTMSMDAISYGLEREEDEMDTSDLGFVKADSRKSKKPEMEKKRRQRINNCLNDLKGILLNAMSKDPGRHSKLEKADILELTVKHLQTIQRNQLAIAMATDPSVLQRFKNGFSECASEVSRYMGRMEGPDPGLKQRMGGHLSVCIGGLNQVSPLCNNSSSNNNINRYEQPVRERSMSYPIIPIPINYNAPPPSATAKVEDLNNNNNRFKPSHTNTHSNSNSNSTNFFRGGNTDPIAKKEMALSDPIMAQAQQIPMGSAFSSVSLSRRPLSPPPSPNYSPNSSITTTTGLSSFSGSSVCQPSSSSDSSLNISIGSSISDNSLIANDNCNDKGTNTPKNLTAGTGNKPIDFSIGGGNKMSADTNMHNNNVMRGDERSNPSAVRIVKVEPMMMMMMNERGRGGSSSKESMWRPW